MSNCKDDRADNDQACTATVLKIGEWQYCKDAEHGAEVRDNVEESQDESKRDAKLEANQAKADGENDAEKEANDDLSAKKCDEDITKLAAKKYDVVAAFVRKKTELFL